jgi:hypothetical protein
MSPGNFMPADCELLTEYFQLDSVFALRFPSTYEYPFFIQAHTEVPLFPSLEVDTTKVSMLYNPFPQDNLLEVDIMIPSEEAEIIYTYVGEEPDTVLQGEDVGVRYNYSTTMLTFPLYVMEPYDSVLILAQTLLEYVRQPQGGIAAKIPILYIPDRFRLKQNYPNPFNNNTAIEFEVPYKSLISIKIFDILGREVENLTDEFYNAGVYKLEFDGSSLSTGLYFIQMNSSTGSFTRKMILLK